MDYRFNKSRISPKSLSKPNYNIWSASSYTTDSIPDIYNPLVFFIWYNILPGVPISTLIPLRIFSFSDFTDSPPMSNPATIWTQTLLILLNKLKIYIESSLVGATIKTTGPIYLVILVSLFIK